MPIVDGPTEEKLGPGKMITSTVTLHTNGTCFVEAYLKNQNRNVAMRGRVAVVCLDDQGRAHWVSPVYAFPTMCGTWDPTCKSEGKATLMEQLPDVIGQLTRSLDVHRWDGESGLDWHQRLIKTIQEAQDVYEEIKPYLDKLAVMSGVGG